MTRIIVDKIYIVGQVVGVKPAPAFGQSRGGAAAGRSVPLCVNPWTRRGGGTGAYDPGITSADALPAATVSPASFSHHTS